MPTKAWALVRSTHPGPSVSVTVLAAILSWGFSLGTLEAIVVVLSVLLNQFSVGLSNDAIDAARDREAKRGDKPLVAGEISLRSVWVWALVCGVASLALAGLLHPGVLIAQTVFLLAGWGYNAGLKATVWSALAYAVGFGALPAIISYGASPAGFPPWWTVLIAAGLGIAAHFGNVVPDREDDEAQGPWWQSPVEFSQ
jgi:4-hydroxybenzoate polyprenyltransferase